MIPRISSLEPCSALCSKYLEALRQEGFKGDLDATRPGRLLCATDNSVYQCMPQAVVFPKSDGDHQRGSA